MAFKTWQTGVHIQQDRVLIAALARERGGWCLRRWWAFTLAEGTIRDGKISQPEQLVDALRDSEQLSWLGASLSRELEMSADTLCFDYTQDTFSNTYHVTAAQNKEVETLLALAKTLHLRLATITPDASALANLLPAVAPTPCVAWRDQHQWLWAMRHQWGRRYTTEAENVTELAALLALNPNDIALFDTQRTPWETLQRCHAPLPECGADFTVALALAMSEEPE
ncbi:DNA utilization protein HofM [Enterobacter kobei]|uniref:DNA utilization protein HofM n=1 Tax=Enterobacter kobei TaxID=208224 RepID=UPI0020752725|nr:DNA utilization protein HofM [Enterobacter kobei]MCM7506076.1 DNA utilization protein HofM [Enterobacter kobei]